MVSNHSSVNGNHAIVKRCYDFYSFKPNVEPFQCTLVGIDMYEGRPISNPAEYEGIVVDILNSWKCI